MEAAGDGAGHLVAEGAFQYAGQAEDGQGLVGIAPELAVPPPRFAEADGEAVQGGTGVGAPVAVALGDVGE